jgi:hypothetical protein
MGELDTPNASLLSIPASIRKSVKLWKNVHATFLSRNRDGSPSETTAVIACMEVMSTIVGGSGNCSPCGIELK